MASPNLQIPDIQANQNQKEVTANSAIAALDNAMNHVGSLAVTTSFDFATADTRGNGIVVLTGTPGASFTADMPDANDRIMLVRNSTDAQCTVRNSAGAGSNQPVIAPGSTAMIIYDGADFYSMTLGGGGAAPKTIGGTSYTAIAGDELAYLVFTNSSGISFTIPDDATTDFPLGTVLQFEQAGPGTVTLIPGGSVTLDSRGALLATAGQYAVVQVKKKAANRWVVIGDVA